MNYLCAFTWVRYFKIKYPELVPQLSTAKSHQQMFGAVTKTYFADKIGVSPDKIFCISIMPCSAKKFECEVEAVNDAFKVKTETPDIKDVDMVLTTRELARLLRSVNVAALEETDFDSPLGTGTGAAVIFGRTGGCAGGGGQPIHDGQECAYARGGKLDELDVNNKIRYSHENPDVFALYDEDLEKPLSHLSHILLHTDQTVWSL